MLLMLLAPSGNNTVSAFQKISDAKVERLPPLSLKEAQQAIEVAPGFEVELVASEPLIKSPVAIDFDAQGNLWVVEMVDYSEQENDALGRISRLTDTDHDGTMDRAQIVIDRLSWPTALATRRSSTWVVAPPLLFELQQSNDSNASSNESVWTSRTLLGGFGRQNVQGLANSFRWGLDGKLHLSTSSNGGQLTPDPASPLQLPSRPFGVAGRDISFDIQSGNVASVIGYGQHGMDFTPWGDRLVTSNSDHLQQVVAWYLPELTDAALSKNVSWRRSIAVDGPQAEVFRISPVESWRTIRTQMRLAGISNGLLEGNGRASGYFTSATGVTVYDGDQWLETQDPIAFVADVGSNLVHRKRLIRTGVASRGERIDTETEFLRSRDTWFRPVQFANGPDGCLYIVDMARETIEHPKSLPEPIKSQVDLTSGRDLGRIWRVRASNRPIRRDKADLASLPTSKLCTHLEHPNGWHREKASQLLIERNDSDAIPICRDLVVSSKDAYGRLHALSVLASLTHGLDSATLLQAIRDENPRVRLWAWVFSKRLTPAEWTKLEEARTLVSEVMQNESDVEVQVAMATRSSLVLPKPSDRAKLFTQWLLRGDAAITRCDELRAAIELAIQGETAKQLWDENDWLNSLPSLPGGASFLDAMFYQLNQSGELVQVLKSWPQWSVAQSLAATNSLGRLFDRRVFNGNQAASQELSVIAREWMIPQLRQQMEASKQSSPQDAGLFSTEESTANALRLLSTLPATDLEELLKPMLESGQSKLQVAAMDAWIPLHASLQKLGIDSLPKMPPNSQQAILRALVKNESGAKLLLNWFVDSKQQQGNLPAWVWQTLRNFPSEAIRKEAQRLSPVSEVTWESIAQKYRSAWDVPGNAEQGAAHFTKLCASCHRVSDIGIAIGPSLDSYRVRPNEAIALAIAEPSREMDPKYEQQQVRTNNGEVFAGILTSSSQQNLVLLTSQNQSISIDRDQIEEWKTSGKSLMPDGLLKELDPVALNDLIAFLRRVPSR